METRDWNGFTLSRLMLGTVQFGMPYGVANRKGQPSPAEVREIVAVALAGGVNCLDTAAAYGESEAVLGKTLCDLKAADRVVVVTKVRALTDEERGDRRAAAKAIRQSVEASRCRLGIECLPLVLFHREEDAAFLDELLALRDHGWLRYAGVSCGNRPGAAADFVSSGCAAALQLPGNILDPRHQRSGVLQAAATGSVAVFIRSVFLQGLLTMPEAEVPQHLRDILPVRRRLAELADGAGITLAELAVRAIFSIEGVTCVLAGVETIEQISENIALFNRGPLPPDLLAAVDSAVPALPEALVTPSMWSRLRESR